MKLVKKLSLALFAIVVGIIVFTFLSQDLIPNGSDVCLAGLLLFVLVALVLQAIFGRSGKKNQ